MLSHLLAFLEAKVFFNNCQFGFLAKHSTERASTILLDFLHTVLVSDLIPCSGCM